MLKRSLVFFLSCVFSIVDFVVFRKKSGVVFHGYMGVPSGNCLALYQFIKANKSSFGNLTWTGEIQDYKNTEKTFMRPTPSRHAPIGVHLNYLFFLMRFRIIIVESAGDLSLYLRFLPATRRLKVLLSHGFCLKGSGVLAPNLSVEQRRIWSRVGRSFDLISVSSRLERYLVSSTINAPVQNCVVMGPQRALGLKPKNNDSRIVARKLLQKLYGVTLDAEEQVVFYAPTHRDHHRGSKRPTLFGFDSIAQLNYQLIKTNTLLFVREHGRSQLEEEFEASNIIYTAKAPYVDFDRIYAGIDGLITDYSGVFLEYLCSEIKLAFWHFDIAEYRQDRGFSISEQIFKTGSLITGPESMIEFIELSSVPQDVQLTRKFWHAFLYENSTEEALNLTVDEIHSRMTDLT